MYSALNHKVDVNYLPSSAIDKERDGMCLNATTTRNEETKWLEGAEPKCSKCLLCALVCVPPPAYRVPTRGIVYPSCKIRGILGRPFGLQSRLDLRVSFWSSFCAAFGFDPVIVDPEKQRT